MFLNGFKKPKPKSRGSLITALDIGTSKICCFIARVEDDNALRVIGIGHQLSHGLRSGTVVDLEAASIAIGHAVSAAEQMAGELVRDVIVNISGSHLQSYTLDNTTKLFGAEINDADIARALHSNRPAELNSPQTVPVHIIPTAFSVDNNCGIKDPRGLYGTSLSVNTHMIMGSQSAVRNLISCIERRHMEVEGIVVSSFAAGLSAMVEDEMELGATVIDMGGGTTSIGVFQGGHMVYNDCIPIGGQHVTSDIARGLTTPLVHAERIKTLYGCAISASTDDRELIDVPQLGEDDVTHPNHLPRSVLVSIIQPRIEETFEIVRSRLEASGWQRSAGRRVILTGGASQMPGVRDLAQVILDKQVRHGRPLRVQGLAELTGGPAFATTAGLLLYAQQHFENPTDLAANQNLPVGILQKVSYWLRENL